MSFEAINTDRSAASWRICCSARRGFQLNLALGVADDRLRLGLRLLPHLFAKPFGIGAALGDDRLRLHARFLEDLGGLLTDPLQFARAPAARPRATSGSAPDGSRAPAAAAARRTSPAADSRTRNVRMVQMNRPGIGLDEVGCPSMRPVSRQDYFVSTISANTSAENRDAFEQEERQVHGAGDLVGGGRLAGDAFRGGGGELADAEARADHDHAEPDRPLRSRPGSFPIQPRPWRAPAPAEPACRRPTSTRRPVLLRPSSCTKHQIYSLRVLSWKSHLSDEREWPCR